MKKAALITGGAIRLGKAIAIGLAKYGFDIAIHYHSSEKPALETLAEIQSYGVECEAFHFNLSTLTGMEVWFKTVIERFPYLNLLVNSASGYIQKPILETLAEDFDNQLAVNLRSPFFLCKYYRLHSKTGNIINIIDNKIAFNQNTYAAYLLTKKSLAEFTKMAALEFSPHIRVNGIAPGVILPAPSRSKEYIEWRKQGIPLKMQGSTHNITQGIINILENDFITGQIFTIDGGESISNVGKHAGAFEQNC